MFIVTVQFEIDKAHVDAFVALLMAQAANSLRHEVGCHVFDVGANPDAPGEFFLYERYDDESAFKSHLETTHYREFDQQVSAWTCKKTVQTWYDLKDGT